MRILKYLKGSWRTVLLILLLLVVQAFCDLSLPSYTSEIVDVGIMSSGIDSCVPDTLRSETLDNLALFMDEKTEAAVRQYYEEQADGILKITDEGKKNIESLSSMLMTPEVMLMSLSSGEGPSDIESIKAALAGNMLTKEELLSMASEGMQEYDSVGDSMLEQMGAQFVRNEYTAQGIDVNHMQTSYVWNTGLKMLGITVLMVSAAILVGLLASRLGAGLGMELRGKVFKRVVSFSNAEIDKFQTASLITRSTNDIQQVQNVAVMMLRMVLYAPIIGIGGIIKVTSTRTGMGWIIIVAVAAISVLVLLLVNIAMPKFKKMQKLVDRLNLVSREILTGVPVIRAFSREKFEEKRFDGANRDLTRTQLFTGRVMAVMMPVMMLIMNGITILIIWFGAKGINLGNLQIGDMMAFITYTMQIVMAFMMLTMISIMLPRANVAAARIDEVLETEPSIGDSSDIQDEKLSGCSGRISFENVDFRYPNASEDALHGLSFTAEPGQTTAIIGSTGSGKSTLVNLIPRFYDVSGGRITIDGVDIRDVSQHRLHEIIGYVPQRGVLFSGTIESNLKFGGDYISDKDMEEAAEIAQASEFISQKEERFGSPIAQGGTNVSGGQKQRLSIARAVAKHPKIFIFDDSFSALDYKTDVVLRRALSEKTKGAVVIIVAQRISTILHADKILVLDEGAVVGCGRHEDLLKTCETYREIARSQLSERELGMTEVNV